MEYDKIRLKTENSKLSERDICTKFITPAVEQAGWQQIYLALHSVEMSKLRVVERVSHGGHDIPLPDIERRFPRSFHNLLTVFSSV